MEKVKVRFIANHIPGFAYTSGVVVEVDKQKITPYLISGKAELVKEELPTREVHVQYAKRGRPKK